MATSESSAGIFSSFLLSTNSSSIIDVFDSDIDKIIFDTKFIGNDNINYTAKCNFWKRDLTILNIICNLKEESQKDFNDVKMGKTLINYKAKKILIFSSEYFRLNLIMNKFPFLYMLILKLLI